MKQFIYLNNDRAAYRKLSLPLFGSVSLPKDNQDLASISKNRHKRDEETSVLHVKLILIILNFIFVYIAHTYIHVSRKYLF